MLMVRMDINVQGKFFDFDFLYFSLSVFQSARSAFGGLLYGAVVAGSWLLILSSSQLAPPQKNVA